jgi:two-component system sensor histidine kinase KdpD
MITHDLKSPLTAIKGLASSMVLEARADGTTSAPVEWAEMIERETDRLTDLVNNLLDMSRLQAGVLALDYEECYPVELLEECASRCRAGGLAGGRVVRVDAPPELPAVVADYGQVQRVLLNLVSNAAKYSSPGGPIHLRARQEALVRSMVFEVSDEGPGIPLEEQDKIFDRFYRSPQRADVLRRPQGFGLGLSICRALVEAHGGQLTVESAPGAGATFRVALPINPEQVGDV